MQRVLHRAAAHSFALHNCSMPYLKSLNGKDASYPKNQFYSNEYFFQNQSSPAETWEAVAFPDGSAFWERSTPSLRYRKMFCWGVQRGGNHWKDFLSREGEGNYFEIQAGLSPTQVHGQDLEPKGCVRFTQVFGGMSLDYESATQDWEHSRDYTLSQIEGQVTAKELLKTAPCRTRKRMTREFGTARPAPLLKWSNGTFSSGSLNTILPLSGKERIRFWTYGINTRPYVWHKAETRPSRNRF